MNRVIAIFEDQIAAATAAAAIRLALDCGDYKWSDKHVQQLEAAVVALTTTRTELGHKLDLQRKKEWSGK